MIFSGKLSKMLDWIISILITLFILSVGIIMWSQYSGIGGFFNDLIGIITIQLPVPFWVAILVGVTLSISFYRNHAAYKKHLSTNISGPLDNSSEDSNRETQIFTPWNLPAFIIDFNHVIQMQVRFLYFRKIVVYDCRLIKKRSKQCRLQLTNMRHYSLS